MKKRRRKPSPEDYKKFIENPPDLFDVYMLAKHVEKENKINWIKIVQILQLESFNINYIATLLALLIALNIVKPESHWQKTHFSHSNINLFINSLELEYKKNNIVNWTDDFGKTTIAKIHNSFIFSQGWLEVDLMKDILSTLAPEEENDSSEDILKILGF
jgi:hypothetical protein